ncbi:MAG: hypothetical protein AAB672_00135 [Patescibacteria group bacterium]
MVAFCLEGGSMKEAQKAQILKEAQEVFFEAMLDGYCGERKHSTKTSTPDGRKVITFVKGDFTVIDEYRVTPHSDKSAGTTSILFKGDLVWWMSYGGHYLKYTIPLLKAIMKANYERGVFNGGRGPENVRCKDVNLMNVVYDATEYTNVGTGDFSLFKGREEIFDLTFSRSLGFHIYFGMSML